MPNLITQATNKSDRFRPVAHRVLQVGDLVLLKEPRQKRYNYAMGRVRDIVSNHLGEVTEAVLLKGNGGTVRRHVTSLIPLLSTSPIVKPTAGETSDPGSRGPKIEVTSSSRPLRKAANLSRLKTAALCGKKFI